MLSKVLILLSLLWCRRKNIYHMMNGINPMERMKPMMEVQQREEICPRSPITMVERLRKKIHVPIAANVLEVC